MKLKNGFIAVITVSFILMAAGLVFSQDPAIVKEETVPEVASGPETQWVWGEVINLDPQNKMVKVKYLDYETDQEKEIDVAVDEKTTYENIKSIEELKQNDAVSIDYIVTPDGKNIAKNISLEKPEEAMPVPAEGMEEVPQE